MQNEDKFIIEVCSKAYAKFVELDLKTADAVFSDNYFDISAGVTKIIEINTLSESLTLAELKQQLKVRSLFDTYEFSE